MLRWLDMEVDSDVVAVSVPLGVYNSREAYFSALQDAGRDQHPKKLQSFGVKYSRTHPFVSRVPLKFACWLRASMFFPTSVVSTPKIFGHIKSKGADLHRKPENRSRAGYASEQDVVC